MLLAFHHSLFMTVPYSLFRVTPRDRRKATSLLNHSQPQPPSSLSKSSV